MTKDELIELAQVGMGIHSPNAPEYIVCEALIKALAQPEHGWTPERIAGIARLKDAQDKRLAQPEQEQLMSDQINYGMSVTQGGKRIDPMSIYKEPEQEPVAWMDDYNACKCPDNEARCFSDKVFRMMQKHTDSLTKQQEPVAKVCHDLDGHIGWNPNLLQLPYEGTPLYTTPPQRKPEQEPVTWRYKIVDVFGRPAWTLKTPKSDTRVLESQPLYTTPPQRNPLTRKEVLAIIDKHPAEKKTGLPMFYRDQVLDIARAIEAAHGIKGEA